MSREIKFRLWDNWGKEFADNERGFGDEIYLAPNGKLYIFSSDEEGIYFDQEYDKDRFIVSFYTGLKDKNGTDSAHFDIANDKYLLCLDLVYGIYLIDISNGAIIRYKEGIINEITGNYFEQHEKISEDCQRSIDELLSQANRTMQ